MPDRVIIDGIAARPAVEMGIDAGSVARDIGGLAEGMKTDSAGAGDSGVTYSGDHAGAAGTDDLGDLGGKRRDETALADVDFCSLI